MHTADSNNNNNDSNNGQNIHIKQVTADGMQRSIPRQEDGAKERK